MKTFVSSVTSLLHVSLLGLVLFVAGCMPSSESTSTTTDTSYTLDYEIRYADSNELISTSLREVAEQENMLIDGVAYQPLFLVTPQAPQDILPPAAIEEAMDMEIWSHKSFTLSPDQAYGDQHSDDLIIRYPLATLSGSNLTIGQQRTIAQQGGVIIDIQDDVFFFDTNPAYTREDLSFTLYRK